MQKAKCLKCNKELDFVIEYVQQRITRQFDGDCYETKETEDLDSVYKCPECGNEVEL